MATALRRFSPVVIKSASSFAQRTSVRAYHENVRCACSRLGVGADRGIHVQVIDHYENPRNVGSLDKKKKTVGTAVVGAPACGDVMKLQVIGRGCASLH